jgi:predicted dienelactone hydrolase
MIGRTDVNGYAAAIRAIQKLEYFTQLARINVPILVMTGNEDSVVPPRSAAEIAAQMPGARFTVIPEADHLSNVESSTVFNRVVRTFIAETLAKTTWSRACAQCLARRDDEPAFRSHRSVGLQDFPLEELRFAR